jgi:hypothetical protein
MPREANQQLDELLKRQGGRFPNEVWVGNNSILLH